MIVKILFVGFIAAVISMSAIANGSADNVTEYSKTGEVLKIYIKNDENDVKQSKSLSRWPKNLCLEKQVIMSIGADGTVTCVDEVSGSITSYINQDLRSAESKSVIKESKIEAINAPCSNGATLIKIDSNGRFECESL